MDWRDLRVVLWFCSIWRVYRRADAIGHPKSNLIAAMQRLPRNLGLRLIERTTCHLRLTDACIRDLCD
jgi:DNA-binding transcriptional LysR family regulator